MKVYELMTLLAELPSGDEVRASCYAQPAELLANPLSADEDGILLDFEIETVDEGEISLRRKTQ